VNGRWQNVEPVQLPVELASSTGPVAVGATGGSGTRVLARLLRDGGVFIGTNLNPYEDVLAFGLFSDRWINRVEGLDGQVDAATCTTMSEELLTILGDEYAAFPDGAQQWGWKEPRSIYLLPFFVAAMPALRFVHFVRDGRDMAFSENQNQLNWHGSAILRPDQTKLRKPAQSIAVWTAINSRAADYGETAMGDRYLRVRFEDLCSDPAGTARRVYRFLGLPGDPGEAAQAEVAPPKTLGRWRDEKPERIRELEEIAGPALTRFGYL
jgi:hypothetical protein